jgi:glycosyltransferase involved in cell wall biosynthesis
VICVSQAATARFPAAPREKMFVVHNGVDLELFTPAQRAEAKAKLGLSTAEPVLGYAGRIAPEKGIALILRAFALVRRQLPQARLVIAGRGLYEPEMKRLADELGLGPSAMFVGHKDRSLDAIAALDLLFFPSRAGEGLSRILIEAMACGIPALASDDTSNPEVVTDGQDGFIFRQDLPEAYAEKALLLLGDRKMYEQFSSRAQEKVRGKFDARHTSQKIHAIYDHLLSSKGDA